MISTYGRVLIVIKKVLWKLLEEYQGIGRPFQDLVEGQKRNAAQLAKIGTMIEQK